MTVVMMMFSHYSDCFSFLHIKPFIALWCASLKFHETIDFLQYRKPNDAMRTNTHTQVICDKNAKMECMFGWNYVYFSISCRAFMFAKVNTPYTCTVHTHVWMHNVHSPVTWLCHIFVAMQLQFYPAYHPLDQCKCRETVFPYLSKSRDSCWCREQLPLLFQLKQRHRTCHGTYISHHFNILCTAGFLRSRILNTMWSVWNVYWWYAQNRSTSCYCMCGARASKIESISTKLSLSSCLWLLTVWVSLSLSFSLGCSLSLSFPRIRIQHVRSIYRPILFWLIPLNVLSVCRCVLLLLHSLHAF